MTKQEEKEEKKVSERNRSNSFSFSENRQKILHKRSEDNPAHYYEIKKGNVIHVRNSLENSEKSKKILSILKLLKSDSKVDNMIQKSLQRKEDTTKIKKNDSSSMCPSSLLSIGKKESVQVITNEKEQRREESQSKMVSNFYKKEYDAKQMVG